MRASKLHLILLCIGLCAAASGCSPLALLFPEKPVYVPPGAMAEVAAPRSVDCWITNKKTGERERRPVEAGAGWYLVRPKLEEFGTVPALAAPELGDKR